MVPGSRDPCGQDGGPDLYRKRGNRNGDGRGQLAHGRKCIRTGRDPVVSDINRRPPGIKLR